MNATISIKTTAETKTKAQKIAESLGMNLTTILDRYLKLSVKTKGGDLREEPSEYLLKSLKESEEDVKAGRVISFKDITEELAYLDKLIAKSKKKKAS